MSDAVYYTWMSLNVLLMVRAFVAKRMLDQALEATRLINDFDMKHAPERLSCDEIERRYARLPGFYAVALDLTAWSFFGSFPELVAEVRARSQELDRIKQGG